MHQPCLVEDCKLRLDGQYGSALLATRLLGLVCLRSLTLAHPLPPRADDGGLDDDGVDSGDLADDLDDFSKGLGRPQRHAVFPAEPAHQPLLVVYYEGRLVRRGGVIDLFRRFRRVVRERRNVDLPAFDERRNLAATGSAVQRPAAVQTGVAWLVRHGDAVVDKARHLGGQHNAEALRRARELHGFVARRGIAA